MIKFDRRSRTGSNPISQSWNLTPISIPQFGFGPSTKIGWRNRHQTNTSFLTPIMRTRRCEPECEVVGDFPFEVDHLVRFRNGSSSATFGGRMVTKKRMGENPSEVDHADRGAQPKSGNHWRAEAAPVKPTTGQNKLAQRPACCFTLFRSCFTLFQSCFSTVPGLFQRCFM
jgi:hypothetical protein